MMRAAGALTARLPSVLLLLVLMLVMVTVTLCSRPGNRRSEPVPMCHRVCDGPLVPCGGGDEKEQHDHTHYKPRRHLPVSRSSCRRVRGLTSGQRRFCRRHPELLRVLLSGYQLGAADCRHRFRHQRWNCAALGRHLDFGHVQVRGTREAAVMYALQSAAVTHALYAACRRGSVPGCACRQPGPDTRAVDFWKWSGCGEGLAHSGRQARRFLNARETEGDARSLMNRHNNRAGVKAVTGGRRRRCHCHGPSGSCSVRTCWLDAPSSFSVIGDRLQQQLERSQLVQLVELAAGRRRLRPVDSSSSGSGSSSSSRDSVGSDSDSDSDADSSSRGGSSSRGSSSRSRRGGASGRIERGRLVHLEPSPNYCEPDPAIGHNGTIGRVCRKNRDAAGSCEYLCCGRGYNTRVTSRKYCCNFHQRPGSPTVCRQRTRVRTCQ